MADNTLLQAETPAFAMRAVHLDLKGAPPRPELLAELPALFAFAGYNAAIVEWEDTFPWRFDERIRNQTAYTAQQVERFHQAAAEAGVQVIPLVQTLGHMETPLGLPGYEKLQVVPGRTSSLNPLAEGARDLVEKMIDEVLDATPGVTHFHLGGDEARELDAAPQTKDFVEKHGLGALYLHHVEPLLDKLLERGVRPILWHDMMIAWEADALERLGRKSDLMVWGYRQHPDAAPYHYNTKYIQRFHEAGMTLWGGTAFKSGATGLISEVPDFERLERNAMDWVDVGRRFGFKGVCATGWARGRTNAPQKDPIYAALDSMINVGAVLHDGQPPAGGVDACRKAVEDAGHGELFEGLRQTLAPLTEARKMAWTWIEWISECLVTARLDPRRKAIGQRCQETYRWMSNLEKAADEARGPLSEMLEEVWVERFLAQRVQPAQEAFERLRTQLKEIDPEGVASLETWPGIRV